MCMYVCVCVYEWCVYECMYMYVCTYVCNQQPKQIRFMKNNIIFHNAPSKFTHVVGLRRFREMSS